jgi:hypothetical protein
VTCLVPRKRTNGADTITAVKAYAAPWSKSLLIISALAAFICVGVTIDLLWKGYNGWKIAIPLA